MLAVLRGDGAVRLFVVGHRFTLGDARSYDAFTASVKRHLVDMKPCLSERRPNLVVFPEDAGRMAWFVGGGRCPDVAR